MIASLNGVSINPNMIWPEWDSAPVVACEAKYTIGGRLVLRGGNARAINCTLTATADTGWLTKTMVDALKALAVDITAVYVLEYGGASYNVMFRHEESPVVEMQPIIPRPNPAPSDFYIGTLKLRLV